MIRAPRPDELERLRAIESSAGRTGFRILTDVELGPGLRRVRASETDHGLDPDRRVCTRREL